MHKYSLFILLLGLCAQAMHAQVYVMSNGQTISTCSGLFIDPGGANGNYANNLNYVYTICPDMSTGTHTQLTFAGVNLGPGDDILFYDGNSTAAPLIFSYTDLDPGTSEFIAQASVLNANNGCLTVEFISDGSGVGAGWGATISCIPACQNFFSKIVSSVPAIEPVDTGYIDLCPGQILVLSGGADYFQNNISYTQSDFTTMYEWQFGDGDIAYGPNVIHKYNNPGGYILELKLKDVMGCKNTNYLRQRVRVSPRPVFDLGDPIAPICAGDTIVLNAIVNVSDTTLNLSVVSDTMYFSVGDIRADSIALPDGVGVTYTSTLTTSQFGPGLTLTDVNQLEGICVNMEHSWMHDLQIWITCPNGQSVILQQQVFSGFCNLGEPIDNDGTNPTGGVGYDYCWAPTATNGNWTQVFLNGGTISVNGLTTLPAGDYSPYESFSNLIGCPLNGDWTLSVLDNWASDNGFVYSWGIDFASYLYPEAESFASELTHYQWLPNNSIIQHLNDSLTIMAVPNAGQSFYNFWVQNDFGCVFDTSILVNILPSTHPNCYNCQGQVTDLKDTTLCGSPFLQLDATLQGPGIGPTTFEYVRDYKLGFVNHPHSNPFVSTLNINSILPATLTNPLTQIQKVCFTLETDTDMDITVRLQAPNNATMELTSGNGGFGDDYINTCFAPTATQNVTTGTAPFTGTWIPEGSWSTLNGAPVNGNWRLLVSDGAGPTKFGKFKSWSITFNASGNTTYNWSPAQGLSCSNCPNPVVSQSGTYAVTASNPYGCTFNDQLTVSFLDSLPPVELACLPGQNGNLTVSWPAYAGVSDYLVSINNGPFQTTNQNSFVFTGLPNPSTVTVQVLPQSPTGCFIPTSTVQCDVVDCQLSGYLTFSTPVSCFGTSDGSAFVSSSNGFTPILYSLDGAPFQSSTVFFNLSAGLHTVIFKDNYNCLDTVTFTTTSPPPIALSTTPTPPTCFGGNNGQATALANGGAGGFSYSWNTIPMTSGVTANNLAAGTYTVTATDASGCTTKASVVLNQPQPLVVQTGSTPAGCFGLSNGTVSATSTGGTPQYSYIWSNGTTNAQVNGVSAGTYTVTVTDIAGCTATGIANVNQPSQLNATVNALPTLCAGIPNGSASVFVNGGTPPYTYNWSGGTPTGNSTIGLTAGTISVTVTDLLGCQTTDSDIVVSPPLLDAAVSNLVSTSCHNSADGQATAVATGGTAPYFYIWSNGVTQVSNSTLSPGNHQVIIQDAFGCRDTVFFQIEKPQPVSTNINSTPTLCAGGADGTATVLANGGSGSFSYLWSNGSTTQTIVGLTPGIYSVTVSDTNGCTASTYTSVNQPTAVSIQSITKTPVSCFGGSNALASVNVNGGTPPYSFTWSTSAVTGNNLLTGLAAGNYTVTVTDFQGCTTASTFIIHQPSALVINGFANNVTCFGGNNGIAFASVSGGTYPYSYLWSNTDQDSIAGNLTSGNYTVTVTDANGCNTSFSITVAQPATTLTATVTQTAVSCFGAHTGSAQVVAQGGTPPYSYFWSNLNTLQTANSLFPITYTVTVTDQLGCTTTSTQNIIQHGQIEPVILPTHPTCHNGTDGQVNIPAVNGGGGTALSDFNFVWQTSPPQFGHFAVGLSGGQGYQVLITSVPTGCNRVVSVQLNNPDDIQLSASVVPLKCHGDKNGSVLITASGPQAIDSYTWSSGAQTGNSPIASNLSAGLYNVTVTDVTGCTKSLSIQITQPPPIDLTNFKIKPITCNGLSDGGIRLQPSGGTPPFSYSWSNSQTDDELTYIPGGVYEVTVTDSNACTKSAVFEVTAPEPIELTALPIDVTCHGGFDGRITLDIEGGTAPYMASVGNNIFVGTDKIIGLFSGTYTVFVRDNNGCTATVKTVVGQPEPFSVNLGADLELFYSQTVNLSPEVSNNQGAVSLVWSTPNSSILNCNTCPTVEVTPVATTFVSVEATDSKGCKSKDLINLFVELPRFADVPTGFTPNGDENNSILGVFGKSGTEVIFFRIFDRWGNLVFEDGSFMVNDPTRGWDGTYKGEPLDPGVYAWSLEVRYKDKLALKYEGHTNLIR